MYKKVESLNHLKELATEQFCECFVLLNFGVRSSKQILWDEDSAKFEIVNGIDDTEQSLTEAELHSQTIIPEAIEKSALYLY